jgi:hypothetical protein
MMQGGYPEQGFCGIKAIVFIPEGQTQVLLRLSTRIPVGEEVGFVPLSFVTSASSKR